MTVLLILTALAFAAAVVVAGVLAAAAPAGRLVSQAAGAATIVIGPILTLVIAVVLGKFGVGGETLTAADILRIAAPPAFGTLFVGPLAFWFFRRRHPLKSHSLAANASVR